MALLAFFKRPPPPPTFVETPPPPTSSSRREKEKKWLASVSPKVGSNAAAAKAPTGSSAREEGRARVDGERQLGQSMGQPQGADKALRPMSSSASLRSTGTGKSRRSFWGGKARASAVVAPTFVSPSSGVEGAPRRHADAQYSPSLLASPKSTHSTSTANANVRDSRVPPTSSFIATTPSRPSRAPGLPTIVPSPTGHDPTTKSLATRLQELATSNADGLLDDNEYRMLRGQLFLKYASGSGDDVLALSQGVESVPRLGDGVSKLAGGEGARR